MQKKFLPATTIDVVEEKFGGGTRYYFSTNAAAILDFPLSANVRYPKENTKTRAIVASLKSNPDTPLDPLHIACESVVPVYADNDDLAGFWVEMLTPSGSEGHQGIFDGGHRQLALQKLANSRDVSSIKLSVFLYAGFSDADVRGLALRFNDRLRVTALSLANASGSLEAFKELIDFNRYYWLAVKENDRTSDGASIPVDARCSLGYFVSLLMAINKDVYDPNALTKARHPTTMLNTGGNKLYSVPTLKHVKNTIHLLDDLFWIEKYFYQKVADYSNKNGYVLAGCAPGKSYLPDGTALGSKIFAKLGLPVFAAYRIMLDDDNQWRIPFKQFSKAMLDHIWNRYYRDLLKKAKFQGIYPSGFLKDPEVYDRCIRAAHEFIAGMESKKAS